MIDTEIEIRELRLHQRRRAVIARRYDAQMARLRARRQRKAHLDAIALQQGTTRSALLQDYPGGNVADSTGTVAAGPAASRTAVGRRAPPAPPGVGCRWTMITLAPIPVNGRTGAACGANGLRSCATSAASP